MSQHQSKEYSGYTTWKAWDASAFGSFTAKDNAIFSSELRKAGIFIATTTKVLEVGFGNGSFAGWIKTKTAWYVGTETNEELIKRARHAGLEAHNATLDLEALANGRSFDVIAMFDVLEHIDKPAIVKILSSSKNCLSNQGVLIARVPSGDSPFSGHLINGDITHKTLLGSSAIRQLAALTGLEVVSIHDAAYPVFGFGVLPALRRMIVLLIRTIVGSLLKVAYFANEPVVMAPDLVAVFRKRRSLSNL